MRVFYRVLLLWLSVGWVSTVGAQDIRTAGSLPQGGGLGTIRGTVYDQSTGEGLIGASVQVVSTTLGATTDLDGNFTVRNVPAGTYQLRITYVSYQTTVISDVKVKGGAVTVQNVYLEPESVTVGEVVITARQVRNTESSILNFQKMASATLDGLSVQAISRVGDSDVGTAIGRIVGMTVEDGKYAYVRGLGDRYSRTLINGAEIPSLDFNRNAVQIDVFPTSLIDNLVVYKTFTPDLPGNFSGGLVNITTRDFPEKFTLYVSMTAGWNSIATGNSNFLTYNGGATDWLGMDDGSRDVPRIAQNTDPVLFNGPFSPGGSPSAEASFRNNITRGFNQQMVPTRQAPPLDHGMSFSLGNQHTVFGNKSLGYVVALTYKRSYMHLQGDRGVWALTGAGNDRLSPQFDLRDTRSSDDVLWSALANVSLRLSDNHKIVVNYLRNQSGERSGRELIGLNYLNDASGQGQRNRALDYFERSNDIAQLRGEHNISSWNNFRIEWIASYTKSQQTQPDFRTYSAVFDDDANRNPIPGTFQIPLGLVDRPVRAWRFLDEDDLDSRVHLTLPFKSWTGAEAKLKGGGSYTYKDRDFRELRYVYFLQNVNSAAFGYSAFGDNNSQGFWDNNFLRLVGPDPMMSQDWQGQVIGSNIEARNQYAATERIGGAYLMVDLELVSKLRLIAGVRYESTAIAVQAGNGVNAKLELNDLLPMGSLIYATSPTTNVRLGFSRTLARPIFRELAPFVNFTFAGDVFEFGNPLLRRTLIDNFDLRFEWFPEASELIAVSGFYKRIQNPIERSFNPLSVNNELTWQNVDQGKVLGVEVEVRKNLGFAAYALRKFQLGFNASYIFSEVDVPQLELGPGRVINPNMAATRPLFSQSPYVVNANLAYINDSSGTTVSMTFNIWGERLALVARPGTPNIFEQPRPSLDLNVVQRLGRDSRWSVRFQAQNLLNPEFRWIHTYEGREYTYQSYREGVRLSLSAIYQIK